MSRLTPHQEQQGFLTIAQNGEINYLRLAYVQAMSIKLTMPNSKYAVVVDRQTLEQITDQHRQIFDYIIELPEDHAKDDEWKLSNEWQVFYLTPFKETIKLESDLVFTRTIDHWWPTFRLKDIVLSYGCKNYLQEPSSNRTYRRLFDDNELPDIYNGLMYFRYSQTAAEFFWYAEHIFKHWVYIRDNLLKNCRDKDPTTDVVYALAAKIIGQEKCVLPGIDYINFVHMKPAINKFSQLVKWNESVIYETELPMIRINNTNQYHPLHYYEKSWVTDEIIREYEQCLAKKNF
jgi:hypothetical protein